MPIGLWVDEQVASNTLRAPWIYDQVAGNMLINPRIYELVASKILGDSCLYGQAFGIMHINPRNYKQIASNMLVEAWIRAPLPKGEGLSLKPEVFIDFHEFSLFL